MCRGFGLSEGVAGALQIVISVNALYVFGLMNMFTTQSVKLSSWHNQIVNTVENLIWENSMLCNLTEQQRDEFLTGHTRPGRLP